VSALRRTTPIASPVVSALRRTTPIASPVVSAFRRTTRIASCFIVAMILKHPEPLRDFDYLGMHYYSLTWCCDNRKSLFTKADCVDLVRDQFVRAAGETGMAITAWSFMPDHVHQLVKGCSGSADGRRYMRLAKQYSGFYFSRAEGQKLWQRYGHDRFLRKDEEPRTIVRYIIENPLRAGLVQRVEDYPFTGSQIYSMKELMEWAYQY